MGGMAGDETSIEEEIGRAIEQATLQRALLTSRQETGSCRAIARSKLARKRKDRFGAEIVKSCRSLGVTVVCRPALQASASGQRQITARQSRDLVISPGQSWGEAHGSAWRDPSGHKI